MQILVWNHSPLLGSGVGSYMNPNPNAHWGRLCHNLHWPLWLGAETCYMNMCSSFSDPSNHSFWCNGAFQRLLRLSLIRAIWLCLIYAIASKSRSVILKPYLFEGNKVSWTSPHQRTLVKKWIITDPDRSDSAICKCSNSHAKPLSDSITWLDASLKNRITQCTQATSQCSWAMWISTHAVSDFIQAITGVSSLGSAAILCAWLSNLSFCVFLST